MRRALDVLEAEGLAWRRHGAGTFVGPEPPQPAGVTGERARRSNPLEVPEARLNLEPARARLAALRASAEQVGRMRALADRVAGATDDDARELWDGALHRAIAKAAGDALLLVAFDVLDEVRACAETPPLRDAAPGHAVACWRAPLEAAA